LGVSSLLHSQHLREMRFVTLAVVLLFSATIQCYASPTLSGDAITQADLLFKTKENFQHYAKTFAFVEEATMNILQQHVPAFSSFRPSRKLLQEINCANSTSLYCVLFPRTKEEKACAEALGAAAIAHSDAPGAKGPFYLASLLCMLPPSCVSIWVQMFKTCVCGMDLQPMYDIVCPNSPTATACSRNPAVRSFVALSSDPLSMLFPGVGAIAAMYSLLPTAGKWTPDFKACGDPALYRRTVLINSLGVCLDELVASSPLFTLQTKQNFDFKILGNAMKCVITFPSFIYQAVCSGNVGKCYSAGQLSAVSECKNMTQSFCPAGCKQQLAAAGASSSTFPAKCCVKWFQEQATAPACSSTPTISISNLIGQDCVNAMSFGGPISSQLTNPVFPAICTSQSSVPLAVANCAVTTTLEPTCPNNAAPFVKASMYAPQKVSIVTLTFPSATLKAVRGLPAFVSRLISRFGTICVFLG
jgi:hypothetical protein